MMADNVSNIIEEERVDSAGQFNYKVGVHECQVNEVGIDNFETKVREGNDEKNGLNNPAEPVGTEENDVSRSFDLLYKLRASTYKVDIEDGVWEWHEELEVEDDEDCNGSTKDEGIDLLDNDLGDMSNLAVEESSDDDKDEIANDEFIKVIEKNVHVPVERKIWDEREDKMIEKFYGENAKQCCPLECSKRISKDLVLATRLSIQELTKSEQDLIILAYLQSHRRVPSLKEEYGKKVTHGHSRLSSTDDDTYRKSVDYMYCGVTICRTMFLFIYDIGEKRYKNLMKHFSEHGFSERGHKSTGKVSTNKTAMTSKEREEIIQFITTYAEKHAIPLPGRMPHEKDCRVVKLPASDTRSRVYRSYVTAVEEENKISMADESEATKKSEKRTFGYKTFLRVWNAHTPFVTTTKPAQDLCDTCRSNTNSIVRLMNASEDKRKAALKKAEEHLDEAKRQRKYYNECRNLAREKERIVVDGEEKTLKVLSFDFAEQVHYPSSARKVGPAFFKTARKCGAFGVHDERTRKQHNYLIDEADSVGKGANVIASLLHHYLKDNNADVLILFADNCIGQNKNNTILQYLQWRVKMGHNTKIELNFMIAGHTKFSPDRGFGIWKFDYRRAEVEWIGDLIVLIESSPGQFNIAIPTIFEGKRNVVWYNWTDYLSQYFRKFPGLTGYHRFEFKSDGYLKVGKLYDSELETKSLQTRSLDNNNALVIEEIIPEPLNITRQWYLFTEIRDLCNNDANKDKVAPQPLGPKPKFNKNEVISFKKGKPMETKEPVPTQSSVNVDVPKEQGRSKVILEDGISPHESAEPKKRGRPKKVVPEDGTTSHESVPKKRGRPKKVVPEDGTSSQESV